MGIAVSFPSKEKRVCPTYRVCKKLSKISDLLSISRRSSFSSMESCIALPFSICSWNHASISQEEVPMYSKPILPQYKERKLPITSRSAPPLKKPNAGTSSLEMEAWFQEQIEK